MSEIHVTGLKELAAFLDELPAKLQNNVMRGALRAGANEIKKEAQMLCPIGPPNAENVRLYGGYEGALRDSIRVGTRSRGGIVTSMVKAGGKIKNADVFYAHIVEFGAKAHTISAVNGGALSFGGGVMQSVNHPGIKPHPFMRPALDGQAQIAVVSTAEYMKQRLATKFGLDTADVLIEGDEL